MDTLFNWTDVISIQAERTTNKTWYHYMCSSLCFLLEELLYYNQSSSNEKFLARACFQDILCIRWHQVASKKKEICNEDQKLFTIKNHLFYFCLLQINVNRGIITRIIYFISIWIEMSWADKPVLTTTKSRNFKYLCFQLCIYSQDETASQTRIRWNSVHI